MTDNLIGGYTREVLAELCDKATVRPWHISGSGPAFDFFSAARAALPAALQRIAELQQQLAEIDKDRDYLNKADLANEWEDRYQIQQEKIAELEFLLDGVDTSMVQQRQQRIAELETTIGFVKAGEHAAVAAEERVRNDNYRLLGHLDAIAEALHPHKPKFTEERWTYLPDQLAGMVRELRESRDKVELSHNALLEQYHEVRAACRAGLSEAENVVHPGTLEKIRFVQREVAALRGAVRETLYGKDHTVLGNGHVIKYRARSIELWHADPNFNVVKYAQDIQALQDQTHSELVALSNTVLPKPTQTTVDGPQAPAGSDEVAARANSGDGKEPKT